MSPMSPWGDIFIDQQHTVPILLDGGAVAGLALRPVAPALSAREANVCVRCAIGDRRGAWFPAGPVRTSEDGSYVKGPPVAPPQARPRPTPFVRATLLVTKGGDDADIERACRCGGNPSGRSRSGRAPDQSRHGHGRAEA